MVKEFSHVSIPGWFLSSARASLLPFHVEVARDAAAAAHACTDDLSESIVDRVASSAILPAPVI
jgi:hypothetical protein